MEPNLKQASKELDHLLAFLKASELKITAQQISKKLKINPVEISRARRAYKLKKKFCLSALL